MSKKLDSVYFIGSIMMLMVVLSIFITVSVSSANSPLSFLFGNKQADHDGNVINEFTTFDAENHCLDESKNQVKHYQNLYVDARSTKRIFNGYKVFVKEDESGSHGKNSIWVCSVSIIKNSMKIISLEESSEFDDARVVRKNKIPFS